MVRERKDFYQLKKAVGEDPVPEAEVAPSAADATGAADAAHVGSGASADPAPKRKKKKAKRARSASEVEVDVEVEEDLGVPEATEIPAGSVAPTTAREEMAYEEQLLDRRYWKELQTTSQGMLSVQTANENLAREKEELEAKLVRSEVEAEHKESDGVVKLDSTATVADLFLVAEHEEVTTMMVQLRSRCGGDWVDLGSCDWVRSRGRTEVIGLGATTTVAAREQRRGRGREEQRRGRGREEQRRLVGIDEMRGWALGDG
ncbi:hypothetical protein M0R45_026226 [Rubus argutus]|uniref:Uncharacterized protein n=1 Tax=Rubus argutus TaxID=59490 RepID=A0AAW1WYP5_RUBAR